MSELLRKLVGRLRVFVGDRHRAPRRKARFRATVKFRDAQSKAVHGATSNQHSPEIEGFTRDVSTEGLALVVPTIRIGTHYLTDDHVVLLISIELPDGLIELQAAPVRYDPLELEQEGEKGYLLGVKIIEMSDDARASLNEVLKV